MTDKQDIPPLEKIARQVYAVQPLDFIPVYGCIRYVLRTDGIPDEFGAEEVRGKSSAILLSYEQNHSAPSATFLIISPHTPKNGQLPRT